MIKTAYTAYVMAPFEDWRDAREVRDVLVSLGYVIHNDWTIVAERDNSIKGEDVGMADDIQARLADEAMEAAKRSTLGVLVCGPHFPSIGSLTEFGMRVGSFGETHVILNDARNSIFWKLDHVRTFEDLESWRASISE